MGLRRDGVHGLTRAGSVGNLVELQDIDDDPLDPSPRDSPEEKQRAADSAEDTAPTALTHDAAGSPDAAPPTATPEVAVTPEAAAAAAVAAGPAVAPAARKLEYATGECCLCRAALTTNTATFFGVDRTFCSNECRTRCLVAWEAAKGASSSKAPPSLDRCLAMYWAANGLS